MKILIKLFIPVIASLIISSISYANQNAGAARCAPGFIESQGTPESYCCRMKCHDNRCTWAQGQCRAIPGAPGNCQINAEGCCKLVPPTTGCENPLNCSPAFGRCFQPNGQHCPYNIIYQGQCCMDADKHMGKAK